MKPNDPAEFIEPLYSSFHKCRHRVKSVFSETLTGKNMLQPTKITALHLIQICTTVFMMAIGGGLGNTHYGLGGAFGGCILGFFLGQIIGGLPNYVSQRRFIRKIANSTDEELWRIVNLPFWNFSQSFALLTLAGRNQDIRSILPRILGRLESDDELTRVYGWDALRLAYTDEYKIIADYEPRQTTEICRENIRKLRAFLQASSPDNSASQSTMQNEVKP